MEQKRTQEHIAALCAAGTLGIAATGFALASENYSAGDADTESNAWIAGGLARQSFPTSPSPDPHVAPPVPHITSHQKDETQPPSRSASLFGTRRVRDLRPGTATESDTSGSRGSSVHRGINLRPRTADTRSTSERRDPSTGSSWLKRISTISTATGSSLSASILQDDGSLWSESSLPPIISRPQTANKLVKRSASRRELPEGQRRSFLQRPATSHQRSATIREADGSTRVTQLSHNTTSTLSDGIETAHPPVTWRPYFEHGYPKKRHSISALNESTSLRTIPSLRRRRPTLMLSSSLGSPESQDISPANQNNPVIHEGPSPSGRNRLRRSLSSMPRFSRRRHFTDPGVKDAPDQPLDTTSSPVLPSSISPLSTFSAFNVDMPAESPVLGSSPPMASTRFSFRRKEYNSQSDPTTLSSDTDTRIFSDDDSVDYQSDTAFDSLATRATTYSQRTTESRKVDAIFTAPASVDSSDRDSKLADLMQTTSLQKQPIGSTGLALNLSPGQDERTSDIDQAKNVSVSLSRPNLLQTPSRSTRYDKSDLAATPILRNAANPFAVTFSDDLEDINWSPQSDTSRAISAKHVSHGTNLNKQPLVGSSPSSVLNVCGTASPPSSTKRLSIFDWSENHRAADASKGREIRPRTVHGKQPHESTRSRSSGRKTQNQLHLRSQSVPSNREHQTDPAHSTTSKFGTWGLGHKPVSEEWSDDFEFDDIEDSSDFDVSSVSNRIKPEHGGSVRGVKVPQAIMDRQASVHVQFGQVQEFMLLVEELKRLRAQGAALSLLDTHSRVLWEDAESIINLATINDEDEELAFARLRTSSMTDTSPDDRVIAAIATNDAVRQKQQTQIQASGQSSTSGSRSPLPGRPRGDSLAQAKNFLQTLHQNRGSLDSSPIDENGQQLQKLPFDTQDLKDLVIRSGAITRALKDTVRKAQGVSVSPTKPSSMRREPTFSEIFNAQDAAAPLPRERPLFPS